MSQHQTTCVIQLGTEALPVPTVDASRANSVTVSWPGIGTVWADDLNTLQEFFADALAGVVAARHAKPALAAVRG